MKITITGGSGLLGGALHDELGGRHEVIRWSHTQRGRNLLPVDIREPAAARQAMELAVPDLVIHSAAYRDPDFCERDSAEARSLNVDGTRHVFEETRRARARFVLISTDYVFDGRSPPYREESPVGPINVYGQTKVEAEELVRGGREHLILRLPILYGPGAKPGWDLIDKLRQTAEADHEVAVDDQARRTPTLTTNVAEALAFLLERQATGTFHFSSGDVVTRLGMVRIVADLLGLRSDHLKAGPAPPQLARRPEAALLDAEKIRALGFERFISFAEGVEGLLGRR